MRKKLIFFISILGNILDHYDVALYSLMAGFIAPVFFPGEDPVLSLIKTYGVLFFNTITKPIGAFIFGRIASEKGSATVMAISLIGVALSTISIGLIPSYATAGNLAIILLVLARVSQGVFAAGEQSVAGLFLIDNAIFKSPTRTSWIYNLSTMLGATLAASAAYLVNASSNPSFYWRVAFICGGIAGFFGGILRLLTFNNNAQTTTVPPLSVKETIGLLWQNRLGVLMVAILASFSYVTYSVPFIFMNNFVPIVTNITVGDMLALNNILMILDCVLIPFFGFISEKFEPRKFMAFMTAALAITAIPLFFGLKNAGYMYVIFVRLWIVLLGLGFVAPMYAIMNSQFEAKNRVLLTGFGYTIGSELLGKHTVALLFLIWHVFGHTAAPGVYIACIAMLAYVALTSMGQMSYSHTTNSKN